MAQQRRRRPRQHAATTRIWFIAHAERTHGSTMRRVTLLYGLNRHGYVRGDEDEMYKRGQCDRQASTLSTACLLIRAELDVYVNVGAKRMEGTPRDAAREWLVIYTGGARQRRAMARQGVGITAVERSVKIAIERRGHMMSYHQPPRRSYDDNVGKRRGRM